MNPAEYFKDLGKKAYCWSMCKHGRATFLGLAGIGIPLSLYLSVVPETQELTPVMQEVVGSIWDATGIYSPELGQILVSGVSGLTGIISADLLDEYAMPQVYRAGSFLGELYPALKDWYDSLP
jgi:hypothetical protein